MTFIPKNKPVTLRELAREAKVSHSTVSRALRGDPQISPEKTRIIQKLAAKRGYRPDPMLSALAAYRNQGRRVGFQSVLAWLNGWSNPGDLRKHQEFDAYWKGAEESAKQLGYRLEEFIISDQMPPERLSEVLRNRGVRGLLIPPHRQKISFEHFDFSTFAVIRFGRSVPYPKVTLVSHSQANDVTVALGIMTELGYQRIGYVTSANLVRVAMFDAGYLKCQQAWSVPPLPMLVLGDDAKPTRPVLAGIRQWMKTMRPDAILTTEGNMKALLTAAGFRIPQDVALAATSVSDCDADSGIDQNGAEIGRLGVLSLVGLIQNNQFGIPQNHQDILIRGTWVQGKDLPAVGGSEVNECAG